MENHYFSNLDKTSYDREALYKFLLKAHPNKHSYTDESGKKKFEWGRQPQKEAI
jgi:hypothetical protein